MLDNYIKKKLNMITALKTTSICVKGERLSSLPVGNVIAGNHRLRPIMHEHAAMG